MVDMTSKVLHDNARIPLPRSDAESLYIATSAPLSSLHFGVDTFGSGGTLHYAYQDASGFHPLTVHRDTAADFTRTRPDHTAEVMFDLPHSWPQTTIKEDVLSRQAYWIRVTASHAYETPPVLTKIDATVFTTQATFVQDSFGGYNGLTRATTTADCGSDPAVLREAATTNGVHWYVVRSSAITCTLTVSPPGFLSATFSAKAFTGAPEIITNAVTLLHRMTVTVLDEQGLPAKDAILSFDGLSPDAEQGGVYYFGNEDTTDARLFIRRPGYLIENGSNQNSALAHVSGGTTHQQTTITVSPYTAACIGTVVPGVAASCARLTPNVTILTLHNGQATSTASVTVYADAAKTQIADDRSRVGDNDAGFISDANGKISFALREGTYYYAATATGAPAATGSFVVLPDIGATVKIDYYPPTPSSTTPAADKTTITVSAPSALYANRDLAHILITVKDSMNYRIPDSTVTVAVSSTLSVFPTTQTTNDLGEASFIVRSTRAGSTKIVPTVGGIEVGNGPSLTFLDPPPLQDSRVSPAHSFLTIAETTAPADGSTTRAISVTVQNSGPSPVGGKTVVLTTTCPGTTIQPASATSDRAGKTTFSVKGTIAGDCIFSAIADHIPLTQTKTVSFSAFAGCPLVPAGSLIKLPDDHDPNTQTDSAVYYIGNDCKRHAFPHAHVFNSWYSSFDSVSVATPAELAAIALGKNVTYKPAVRLVKFTSLNKVYLVSASSGLRWIASEAVAQAAYGASWNTMIDDISDAFYRDYTFNADIESTQDIASEIERTSTTVISDML